jgi:arginyl-tRNA synthetase
LRLKVRGDIYLTLTTYRLSLEKSGRNLPAGRYELQFTEEIQTNINMKTLHQTFSQLLADFIKNEYNIELELPLWELPARQEFGDLSTMAAMKLAGRLKRNPEDIAGELKTVLVKLLADYAERIEILKPGFVNIFLKPKVLIEFLDKVLELKSDFFKQELSTSQSRKRKVLLEFVSANPTGPLSIAHGRQAVVGDIIGNILEFCSVQVTREFYINDVGRQIDLLVESTAQRINELKGQPCVIPEGGYQGEYLKDVAKAFIDSQETDLRAFTLSYLLGGIKNDLASAGISFDNWYSQEKLMAEGKVDAAMKYLSDKGLLYEQDDAVWFSSTKLGDDKDRVVKKRDEGLTYFASDIAYHKDKIDRGFTELINLWGPDHHGYINRVKAAIEAVGKPKDILQVIIIQLVTLKSKEKMSKRRGTMIRFSDLVADVGKDTARFYYMLRRNSSILEFDLDLAKEASFNNPLYYVQYACARINSIFKKAQIKELSSDYNKFLQTPEELVLLRLLLQFIYSMEKAYLCLEPVFVIEYLKSLAAGLHKFYETTKVISDDKKITHARLNLLAAARIVLHCGMEILGITPVEHM